MKTPIKFKADSAIGEVFGYFVKREGRAYIMNDVGSMVSVDEESVRQLLGYTKDNEEVYAGDTDKLIYSTFEVKRTFQGR